MDLLTGNNGLLLNLRKDTELLGHLVSLRSTVSSLAETTSRTVPHFTDHTIRHMDALWDVSAQVLTQEEIDTMSSAEAFLLGTGFYLHDIGMAYAATEKAVRILQTSNAYLSCIACAPETVKMASDFQARAISVAVRQLHADAANELATSEIPGTDGRYLFEARTVREAWGRICGQLASSHHWSLTKLEQSFGSQTSLPLPGNRRGDLLYVAACLRLIDYAHMNRDRAPSVDRAVRGPINDESLIHWLAQEHINGPIREDNELVYGASNPISTVDAWWLFYQMLKGLDEEIRGVRRLLDRRNLSLKKLSLVGVRGAASPEELALLIPTDGFLPVEVNLRTGSIERLVEILAGETLYGSRPMLAVRELIQNSRDAVMLKQATASDALEKAALSLPITISLRAENTPPTLEIIDHGIGMTKTVLTDYLITIASDYWGTQFATDFPNVATQGQFTHAGKFGIGFLSVFMLGSNLTVQTRRSGDSAYSLSLHGVGKRGELRTLPSVESTGTKIKIELLPGVVEKITPLDLLVKAYAPMLAHAIKVEIDNKPSDAPAGWLGTLSANDFISWASDAMRIVLDEGEIENDYTPYTSSTRRQEQESLWPPVRPEYAGKYGRLVASFHNRSLVCLNGITVQTVSTPGFIGVIDLESAKLDPSRTRLVEADIKGVLKLARSEVQPRIIKIVDSLGGTGLLLTKYEFMRLGVAYYGREVLTESKLAWISCLKMPGNIELRSSGEFLEEAKAVRSIFLSFGHEPWAAMERWRESATRPDELALAIPRIGDEYPHHFELGNRKKTGSVSELWPRAMRNELMSIVISLISNAWGVESADLLKQKAWTLESMSLWGRWVRV